MERAEKGCFSFHDDDNGDSEESTNAHKPANFDDLSLCALGLPDDVVDVHEVENREASSIARVAVANAYSDIGLFYGQQVISAVAHHSHLIYFFAENAVEPFELLSFPLYLVLGASNDESFVFGRYPRVYLYLWTERQMASNFQEMIIDDDRISRLHVLIECEDVLANVHFPILKFDEFGLKLGIRLSNVSW